MEVVKLSSSLTVQTETRNWFFVAPTSCVAVTTAARTVSSLAETFFDGGGEAGDETCPRMGWISGPSLEVSRSWALAASEEDSSLTVALRPGSLVGATVGAEELGPNLLQMLISIGKDTLSLSSVSLKPQVKSKQQQKNISKEERLNCTQVTMDSQILAASSGQILTNNTQIINAEETSHPVEDLVFVAPKNYQMAMQSVKHVCWSGAMGDEIQSLVDRKVYTLVDRPLESKF